MKRCAVAVRTESGDSYVFLCEYKELDDIVENYLYDQMDEELAYVYEVLVDSGESAEKDDEIEAVIWNKINSMEQN